MERPAAVTVDVEYDERYWYPDDGGEVWLAGYQMVDPETGSYLARDAPALSERGLRVAGVAGAARHHIAGLESDALAPGRPLELRRDAGNPHDPNAIAVFPAEGEGARDGGEAGDAGAGPSSGGAQAGWVPREVAAEIAGDLDAGRPWAAVVLREQRASPREPRTGLTMLLARGETITFRERGARRR